MKTDSNKLWYYLNRDALKFQVGKMIENYKHATNENTEKCSRIKIVVGQHLFKSYA